MANDAEVLRNAYDRENNPKRFEAWKPWAWEPWAVGATIDNIKRLVNEGYITAHGTKNKLTLYVLTDKGRGKGWAESMQHKVEAPSYQTVMEHMELIVGFDDIKDTLAHAVASQKRIHFLLEGKPACSKSLFCQAITDSVPENYAYEAFGSGMSAAGLSEVLFEKKPRILIIDEVDKCKHDAYSVLLGLMEKGLIIETKSGKIRDDKFDTMVIGACNSSAKLSPEFKSRFSFHPYFPEYTREEFIDVCISMLAHSEAVPEDIGRLIGTEVYDLGLGDVRKARGVAQMMKEPTADEVRRVLVMVDKYRLPDLIETPKRRRKYLSQTRLPME